MLSARDRTCEMAPRHRAEGLPSAQEGCHVPGGGTVLGELRTGLSDSVARRGFSANQGCVLISAQKRREQRLAGA